MDAPGQAAEEAVNSAKGAPRAPKRNTFSRTYGTAEQLAEKWDVFLVPSSP
jgi:hypothetical protein